MTFSAAAAADVNPNGIINILANVTSTFSFIINDKPTFNKNKRN